MVIESADEYEQIIAWQKKKRGGITGVFGATKSTSSTTRYFNPLPTIMNIAGQFEVESEGSQYWIGANITAHSVKLRAGTPEKEALIALLPSFKKTEIYVETKTTGFDISFNDGMHITTSKLTENGQYSSIVIPTIFQVRNQFIGYCNGKWLQLSSQITSEGKVYINATEVTLSAAPDININYAYVEETGFGIGFSDKSGEFAVQAMTIYSKESKSTYSATYNQRSQITSKWVHIEAETYKDYGAIYNAYQMDINAKIIFHGVLKNTLSSKDKREIAEVGIKLGIKSNLGQICEATDTIMDADYSKPEGIINAYFAVRKLYDNVLTLLSKATNHGISGGVWFYGLYSKETSYSNQYTAVPSIINVEDMLTSESEELHMVGTQVSTYNMYLKTKYLSMEAAYNEYKAGYEAQTYDMEIPVSGTTSAGLSAAISKGSAYQKLVMNVEINVAGHLNLEVNGHADMRGVFLSANSLDAFFESLLLESIQDIVDNHAWSFGAGISASIAENTKKGISGYSIGGSDQRHKSHVVNRLTAMLGKEHANIVVANALQLNGAMIAATQRNDDGSYTDHGHLVLKCGELFIQHIYDYDNGHTLGASLSYAKTSDTWTAEPIVGAFKREGYTKATIGSGELIVDNGIPTDLNRDVNGHQTMTTDYDVDTIKAYASNLNHEELINAIPKDKDGSFSILETAKSIGNSILEVLPFGIKDFFKEETQEEPEEDEFVYVGYKEDEEIEEDKDEQYDEEMSQEDLFSQLDNPANEQHPSEEVNTRILEQKQAMLNSLHGELNKAEASDQYLVFKRADQFYIVSKHAVGGGILMGKNAFAKQFPDTYEYLASKTDELGEFVAGQISKLDGKLINIFGDKYKGFKSHANEFINEIDKNAPQLVGDGLKLFTIAGAGKLVFSGVKIIDKFDKNTNLHDKRINLENNYPQSSVQKEFLHKDLAKQDVGGEAYQNAMNGGKHATWAKQYIDKPIDELEKGIKSLDKQIKLHQDKIRNPEKYYTNFKQEPVGRQTSNIEKMWPLEIKIYSEQKSILEGLLRERLRNE